MKTTFKAFSLFFILLILGPIEKSFGQFIGQSEINGFTKASEIRILYHYSETEGLIEIGDAYSKARGVTIFSAMNDLNIRAKKKLLEEASVRGASHVLITSKTPDDAGMFGRLFSYQAVFYKHPDLKIDIEQLKSKMDGSSLKSIKSLVSNRNHFGAQNKLTTGSVNLPIDSNLEFFEKDHRVFGRMKVLKSTGSVFEVKTFEVIGMNDESLLLSIELAKDKEYAAYWFEFVKKQ